jgi:UDP-2,3-diacylglucosamine pyrophosphatase LpxH
VAAQRYIAVISDLHMCEGVLEDFDSELEAHLLEFLEWLGNLEEPAELVINGDFLDFVQASPWRGAELESATIEGIPLCFAEHHSIEKLHSIQRDHQQVFAAIGNFLAKNENNLVTVLPGNHDPDFFWTRVAEEFTQMVCPDGRTNQLQLILSGSYRPHGAEWLWIEHGQQHDPVNSFFLGGEPRWSQEKRPILLAADGTPRLLECTGTRFLIRFLNRLDAQFPFVDNVKPFSRFMRIFGMSALVPGWGPLDAAIAVAAMLKYLAITGVTRTRDLLTVEAPDGSTVSDPLAAWLARAGKTERSRLAASIKSQGLALGMPLDMAVTRPDVSERLRTFLAQRPELLEGIGEQDPSLLGSTSGTLTLRAGFKADETEDLFRAAEQVVVNHPNVTTVTMGHTHEPVDRSATFRYFNTGCWTRYYQFTQDEKTKPWKLLRERSYEHFPYRLLYVLVKPGASSASMETWKERAR